MDISLEFPFGGVSEELALSKQEPGTTRQAANVLGGDAVSGRTTGAQRRGLAKYTSQPIIDGSHVQALDVCVFDSKGVDFAELAVGSDAKQWAALSATGEPATNPVLDKQKNLYVIEGRSTIVKRNSDGAVVWIHQVVMPVVDARLSALAIDFDTDVLYTGVGNTVFQDDPIGKVFEPAGFLIRLKQKKDNKVETTWKLPVDGYIGNIKVVKSELYMTVDVPQQGRSRLERYTAIGDPIAPRLDASRRIPFPCSGMSVRNTGVVYTCHPPDPKRGLDPRAPGSTTKTDPSNMWTPEKLKKIPNLLFPDEAPLNLLWSWHLADDLDADLDSGDLVLNWLDRSENGRHLGPAVSLLGNITPQPQPPKFVKLSLGAEPGVRFVSEELAAPTFLTGMSSGPNMSFHKANTEQQSSILPSYTGNTHVICMLVKAGIMGAVSPLIAQTNNFATPILPDGRVHGLAFNAKHQPSNPVPPFDVLLDTGKALVLEMSRPAGTSGTPITQATMDVQDGMAIVTLIYRGPQNSGSPTQGNPIDSAFRYNGTLISTFEGFDFFGLGQTDIGWTIFRSSVIPRGLSGDILEIVSVDTGVTTDAANTDGRSRQIADLIEGYMAHRVGCAHKLDSAHPYNLAGGPPPPGALTGSAATNPTTAKLASKNSILAKWGAARFDCRAVLTTDDSSTANDKGYGYAVEVEPDQGVDNPSQFLYVMGATAPGTVSGGTVKMHRVRDLGQSFSTDVGDGGWGANGRSLYSEAILPATVPPQSPHVVSAGLANRARICVDGWGNVYAPARPNDASTLSVYGLSPINQFVCRVDLPGTVVSSNGLTGSNGIACLQTRDDFGTDVLSRTESLWVASELSVEANADVRPNNTHRVNLVSSTPNGEPSRQVVSVAVAGGFIRWFDENGVYNPFLDTDVPDPPLSFAAPFISTDVSDGKVFFTDGNVYRYFDCHLKKVFNWKATDGGKMPSRARLLKVWRTRAILAAGIDRKNWHAAELGNPFHWDERPEEETPIQAVNGDIARAGKPSDIITALVPWDEDTLLIGGDHTISQISGDPMAGGTIDRASSRMDLISPTVGMAFGNSWCRNRDGVLYFHDNVGAVHVMVSGSAPQNISKGRVETTMRAVNLETFRPVLAYDSDARLMHVLYCANDPADASANTTHFIFEEDTQHKGGAWWPLTFGARALQPTCTAVLDGDSPGDRVLLIGCVDGHVRKFSSTAYSDEIYPINSNVLIGPLAPEESTQEFVFKRPEVVLANDQGGCNFALYGTDRADVLGSPKADGSLSPGRNPPKMVQARGSYVALQLSSNQVGSRWALGGPIKMVAVLAGRKRVRQ